MITYSTINWMDIFVLISREKVFKDWYHCLTTTRHQQLSATKFLPEFRSFLEQYMNYLFQICRLTKLMGESIINAMKEVWAQITDCPGGNSIPMVNRNLQTKFKILILVYWRTFTITWDLSKYSHHTAAPDYSKSVKSF